MPERFLYEINRAKIRRGKSVCYTQEFVITKFVIVEFYCSFTTVRLVHRTDAYLCLVHSEDISVSTPMDFFETFKYPPSPCPDQETDEYCQISELCTWFNL